ncbi:hypothetical protein B9Z55_022932 [Caenorhabditis nigoni]|uniref:F-box domain-containing protein n=1 Tax=Caenorhabditis nigoni TaxID=1611254 RepID=A0A2G5SN31_9PELO|nr:hypothetical protein B9Z55_022932 [Caenorhabditis nigoni]
MPIDFPCFPVLVQEKILDLLELYDLYNFSETSKWSRSLSQRSAKLHEGKIELTNRGECLELTYESWSHPHEDFIINLELKDSKFENVEKYLNVRHSSLFADVTLSYYYSTPFGSAFLTLVPLLQLRYPIKECSMHGFNNNEEIVRTMMTIKKAQSLWLSCGSTEGLEDNFDFKTPFTESLEYETLTIQFAEWLLAWHVINVFKNCHTIMLLDALSEEAEVIEILKGWKKESTIRSMAFYFVPTGSIEAFGAKMVEINAPPVKEDREGSYSRSMRSDCSFWLLQQDNTNAQVLISIEPLDNGEEMSFRMNKYFKLVPEENVPV